MSLRWGRVQSLKPLFNGNWDGEFFLAKIAPTGTALWAKQSNTRYWSEHTALAHHQGRLFALGSFDQGPFQYGSLVLEGRSTRNLLLLQLDAATGKVTHYKLLDEPDDTLTTLESYVATGRSIAADPEGNLVLLGTNGYRVAIADTILTNRYWLFWSRFALSDLVVPTVMPPIAPITFGPRLSPNPCHDQLVLEWPEPPPLGARLQVFNAQGQSVGAWPITQTSLPTQNLPPGIYTLCVWTAEGYRWHGYFVRI